MDSDGILYRPAQTRQAAQGVGSSADELRRRLAAYQQELTGDGDAFGADDLGSLMGMIYGAVHEMAFGSYGDNTEDMGAYAGDLDTMGRAQESSEDLSVIEINNVRKMLG